MFIFKLCCKPYLLLSSWLSTYSALATDALLSLLCTAPDCGCALVHTVPFSARFQEQSLLLNVSELQKNLIRVSGTSRPRNDNESLLLTLFLLCSLNPGHHTTVSLAKLLPQKSPRRSSFLVVTCAIQLFLWVCILQFPLISYQTEGTLHINISRIHHSFII